MGTNTLSSVYKPLYEYRILRVSNSPHLCELCTTLTVIEQHISLYTVSSFTKRPACLEHRQVWLPTLSRSSNSTISIFVRYAFYFTCLFSWCLSRKELLTRLKRYGVVLSKVRCIGSYSRTKFISVWYLVPRFVVPAYRDLADMVWVCSLYRPIQGGLRTGKPSDRYVPPVPGGTENFAGNNINWAA
ncbi:hypothetical protein GW17_00053425 [Ensete ventricosum]|nr:hypothetical protein GW17_00053425 [Ensete ventricosum]